MLGTRLPQQIFCNVYRRCIDRTQSASSKQPRVYTRVSHFKLRGRMLRDVSNTGDLSPIRQQHDKHHSSDDNETTCSSESVSHSLREDDSHSETSSDTSTESNSHSENDNSLYSQFPDDLSEYLGIEPEDRQSKSRKHKLPMAVTSFKSVRYNVTYANN